MLRFTYGHTFVCLCQCVRVCLFTLNLSSHARHKEPKKFYRLNVCMLVCLCATLFYTNQMYASHRVLRESWMHCTTLIAWHVCVCAHLDTRLMFDVNTNTLAHTIAVVVAAVIAATLLQWLRSILYIYLFCCTLYWIRCSFPSSKEKKNQNSW